MSLLKKKKRKRSKRSRARSAAPPERRPRTTTRRRRAVTAGPLQARPARPKRRPLHAAGLRVTKHLGPRAQDVLGVSLIVLAVLSILGVWVGAGGPFGRALRIGVLGLFGPIGYATPVVAGYWAVLLLKGSGRDDRGRMLVGLTIAAAGVLGITSVAGGNPSPAAGYDVVSGAAGVLGAVVVWPMAKVVSIYGAIVVCFGLTFLGILVFTATSLSAVARWIKGLFVEPRPAASVHEPEAAPAPRRLRDRAQPEAEAQIAPAMGPLPLDIEPIIVAEAKQIRLPLTSKGNGYKLPPLDLLRRAPASTADGRDAEHTTAALERTFRNFGVPASVVASHRGPTVTMYEIEVEAGTKVNRVLSLGDDIAYALATPDVRIIAPIPGKSAIGVEVPNKVRDFVMLGDVLSSKAAQEVTKPLFVGLGKDVHGRAVLVNLAEMPHLLIAGATGAGKSSLINTFVTSVLMRTTPDDVKLVLIDPKRVELSHFADLPHLLMPVIVHPKKAAEALSWVVREMETRYETLAGVGMRDIDTYNAGQAEGTLRIPPGQEANYGRLPHILVVIDELADLMMIAPRDVEDAICRIAQMARAVGIHLVCATQRPSVDVVTGLIKANIPSRIAFAVGSQVDSRVILDSGGAEKLLGRGDMLYQPVDAGKPTRIQGAFVSDPEVEGVVNFWKSQGGPHYMEEILEEGASTEWERGETAERKLDPLFARAARAVAAEGSASVSLVQRKFNVGYSRAGRIVDQLAEHHVVGSYQGSKSREVLMTLPDVDELLERLGLE